MPKGLVLTAVFIIALMLNIIVPSLFGIHAHGALPVFLAAMLLYFGASEFSIILGLFFAFLGEIMLGGAIGAVMIPFLAMATALVFIQRLVNSKPLEFDESGIGGGIMAVAVGVLLTAVFLVAASATQYFFAGQPSALGAWLQNYRIMGYYGAMLVIFLLLLRLFSYKRQSA